MVPGKAIWVVATLLTATLAAAVAAAGPTQGMCVHVAPDDLAIERDCSSTPACPDRAIVDCLLGDDAPDPTIGGCTTRITPPADPLDPASGMYLGDSIIDCRL